MFRHARGDKGANSAGTVCAAPITTSAVTRGAPGATGRRVALARELGARYEEGVMRLEIGRRLGDWVQLEAAEGLFADMGAELYLEETRRALADLSEVPSQPTVVAASRSAGSETV